MCCGVKEDRRIKTYTRRYYCFFILDFNFKRKKMIFLHETKGIRKTQKNCFSLHTVFARSLQANL